MRVVVIGAAGYAGGELLRLLFQHPAVTQVTATSRSQAGKLLGDVHPALRHHSEARFVGLPSEALDGAIEDVQKCICEALGLDRSTLLQFSGPGGEAVFTHSWAREGFMRGPLVPIEGLFPWALRRVQSGHIVRFTRVDELPAEAATDKESFHRLGPKSNLTFPLTVGGEVLGALAFGALVAERQWPETLVSRLHLVADMFASALARRRAEAEARRHLQELAHLNRISTVGELTSSLAHELNQPLGAILRNAEAAEMLLQSDVPDLEELRAIVIDIRKDDERAGNVIDRLRSLLKRRKLALEPVGLGQLMDEVVSLLRSDAAGRRVRLETEIPTELPPVRCDRVHLQQVLLNLVMNGMDAMDHAQDDDRRVLIHARGAGEFLIEVAVSDSGPGIPPQTLSQVFEPFFTTKASGMGMGLTISRSIIEAHGGRIRAENNATRGATFTFTLTTAAAAGAS